MILLSLLCLLSPGFGPASAELIRPNDTVTVSEGEDALLPCALSSGQNIDSFDWRKDNGEEEKKEVFMYHKGSYYGQGLRDQREQFKERVEFFKDELKSGNASIKIKNTHLEDNGTYTCVLFEPHKQEVAIRLNVGASPVPYIKPVYHEIKWSLLECKANGVPQPEVEWRNSAGDILSANHNPKCYSGCSTVELQVNVTKSDNYTCVATQRDIYHQINNTMEVNMLDLVAVSEGDDAVLPCTLHPTEYIKSMVFSWRKDHKEVFLYDSGRVEEDKQFKGRLTHFEVGPKSGNASIKILNAHKSDSGRYSCHFEGKQKSHVILQVVERSLGLVVILAIVITAVIMLLLFGIIIAVLYAKIKSLKDQISAPESNPLNGIMAS